MLAIICIVCLHGIFDTIFVALGDKIHRTEATIAATAVSSCSSAGFTFRFGIVTAPATDGSSSTSSTVSRLLALGMLREHDDKSRVMFAMIALGYWRRHVKRFCTRDFCVL